MLPKAFITSVANRTVKQLLTLLCTIALTSVVFIRRRYYELFLKSHHLLSLAMVALLWFHIHIGHNLSTICLGVTSGLWILQLTAWSLQYWLRNYIPASSLEEECRVIYYSNNDTLRLTIAVVDIPLRRPWYIQDGQHIYLTIPVKNKLRYSFQSHPYLIAWASEDFTKDFNPEKPFDARHEMTRTSSSKIQVLIGCREGFSREIQQKGVDYKTPFSIDGFYGRGPCLDGFDKVLFIAGGVGIAAHLLAIRHLLISHEKQTARVRRLSLLWHVHSQGKFDNR